MAIRSLDKKFSCRREAARCFTSLNILLSHSRSLKVIPNNSLEYGACKIKSYFLEGEQVPNIWGPVLLGPTLEPSLSVCLYVCPSVCPPHLCGKTWKLTIYAIFFARGTTNGNDSSEWQTKRIMSVFTERQNCTKRIGGRQYEHGGVFGDRFWLSALFCSDCSFLLFWAWFVYM